MVYKRGKNVMYEGNKDFFKILSESPQLVKVHIGVPQNLDQVSWGFSILRKFDIII